VAAITSEDQRGVILSSEEGEKVWKSVIVQMIEGEICCPCFKEVKWGTVMEFIGANVFMFKDW